MTLEKEFSFARFFKFAMRYLLIAVILVALGIGIGALIASNTQKNNYEKYSGSMVLNVTEYSKIAGIASVDNNTVLSNQAAQIIEAAASAAVKSQTFAKLIEQNLLYPHTASTLDKQERFNADLTVSANYSTASVQLSFIYDVSAATAAELEKNRETAQLVIATYLEIAKNAVCEQYVVLGNDDNFNKVFTLGRIQQSFDLPASVMESNRGTSTVKNAMLGGVVGAVLAAILIFALYLFDPRIKSVEDLLPAEKATALRAEDENTIIKLIARAKVANAKRIAILSLSKDEAYEAWTEKLLDYLKKANLNVNAVTFSTENADWISYFQTHNEPVADCELFFYNEGAAGIAPYIASNADMSVFFVNQRKVMAKTFQKNVESISNDSYDCTIIHNADRAYVG